MSTVKNFYLPSSVSHPDWGTFISPDQALQDCADPQPLSKAQVISGIKADFAPWKNKNADFDAVINKIIQQRDSVTFEDQCSGQYYFDIFAVTQHAIKNDNIKRIAEVGVYMGGASCILAGAIQDTDVELDLIDVDKNYLRFSYERIRRLFPQVAARTRLFFGDLPTYVKNVMQTDEQKPYLIHHDASHVFNVVLRDLTALSYVQDKVHGLMIQDTHLRSGNINSCLFVDAALYAIFGSDFRYYELGIKLSETTSPAFQYSDHGTYFNSNQAEGMFIPFSNANFRYPHPSIKFETFFEMG